MRKRLIASVSAPLSVSLSLILLLAAGRVAMAAQRSGEEIFATTCVSCHGSDGRGASAAQSGLSVRPLDFTDCRRTNREPDHDWHAVIAEGGPARGFHRMMPAFGEVLPESEQETVLDYVRGFCVDAAFPRGDSACASINRRYGTYYRRVSRRPGRSNWVLQPLLRRA